MKPFDIRMMPQRSDEWFQARAGRLTGSDAVSVMSAANDRSKMREDIGIKESEPRYSLRYKLALERVTGRSWEPRFTARSTYDGIQREPAALAAFEEARNECVFSAGFFAHRELMTGLSPDGYLGNVDELIECKCFGWKEHLEALRPSYEIDREIHAQLMHGLWLTGAKATHLVFYNPEFPVDLRLKILTLRMKDKETKLANVIYSGRAELFLEDTLKAVAALGALAQPQAVETVEEVAAEAQS